MLTTTPPFTAAADVLGVAAPAIDALIERLPVGVLLVDRDGHPTYANEAARALPLDDVPPLRWAVARALLTEDATRERAVPLRTADGVPLWVDARVVPVREPGAAPHAALVVVADVTARRQVAEWAPVMESLARL